MSAALGLASDSPIPELRSTTLPRWSPGPHSAALLRRDYDDDYDDDYGGLGDNGFYVQFGGGLTTTTESDGPGEEIDFDEGFAIPVASGFRLSPE